MGIGKRPVNDKIVIMGSSRRSQGLEEIRKDGCPVPLPSGCLKGSPLPTSLDDGVKMICSNVKCPYRDQLMHISCFTALEDNLIKIMSNIGSARGWTDAQRRANLWDKKGLTLIQKKCRCPCGLGLMRLDETTMFQVKQSPGGVVGATPKPKKGKSKCLPTLNFGKGNSCASVAFIEKISKSENKSRHHYSSFGPASPTNSSTSASSSPFTYDQVFERHGATYAQWLDKAEAENRNGTRTRTEVGWTQMPSAAPIPIFDKRDIASVSAPFVSKKVDSSVSYAAAICNPPSIEDQESQKPGMQSCDMSSGSFESLPSIQDVLVVSNKENVIQPSLLFDSPIDQNEGLSFTASDNEQQCSSSTQDDDEDVIGLLGRYELFSGCSFGIGERLIGESFLPGVFQW